PLLKAAKTIMSASPRTLKGTYREAAKKTLMYYHMSPWSLDELEKCQSIVSKFQAVKSSIMERLYAKVGGIPRYVMEAPSLVLQRDKKATMQDIDTEACHHIDDAIQLIDNPHKLLGCFANA